MAKMALVLSAMVSNVNEMEGMSDYKNAKSAEITALMKKQY